MKQPKVQRSSGNVFADLRVTNATTHLAKAELAARIQRIVDSQGLTQQSAAERLGISQPKVSALFNGNLDGFSTDRLFRLLNALGCSVRITVSRPQAGKVGQVKVSAR